MQIDGLRLTSTFVHFDNHFTGKERDTESGNDYFGARYYASSMGRMMSPDPLMATPQRLLDPQEWNMYAYARNNPLSITDPTGLDIWLKGCGKSSATCKHNYVGTTDKKGKLHRTHLTGDQTKSGSLGNRGISVQQDGKNLHRSVGHKQGRARSCAVGRFWSVVSFHCERHWQLRWNLCGERNFINERQRGHIWTGNASTEWCCWVATKPRTGSYGWFPQRC